jgi:(2Fe-2S) ferredoxin
VNLPKYRVFVCTKQRSPNKPEGCCHDCGGLEIYQTFQEQIKLRQLEGQVEIRTSGCLDHCEAGAVALVFQPKRYNLSWLPKKFRQKIQRRFASNKHYYGYLNPADIPELVESHFVKGKPLKRCEI